MVTPGPPRLSLGTAQLPLGHCGHPWDAVPALASPGSAPSWPSVVPGPPGAEQRRVEGCSPLGSFPPHCFPGPPQPCPCQVPGATVGGPCGRRQGMPWLCRQLARDGTGRGYGPPRPPRSHGNTAKLCSRETLRAGKNAGECQMSQFSALAGGRGEAGGLWPCIPPSCWDTQHPPSRGSPPG